MPRSGADARRRLQEAALELYLERGYDLTTTAEIAARAGVNHRTYFRHFPDKREVLFDGQERLRDALVAAVRDAPADAPPLAVLLTAFRSSASVLEDHRNVAAPRLSLIDGTPALKERDLAKGAAMADALAGVLHERGESRQSAALIATLGWAAFHHAATQWSRDQSRPLVEQLDAAFDDLAAASRSVR